MRDYTGTTCGATPLPAGETPTGDYGGGGVIMRDVQVVPVERPKKKRK
ncbi:MAG: hypothetical protein V7603_1961 [Micromonosporaceae bacterium]